jgi:hypothetical protein
MFRDATASWPPQFNSLRFLSRQGLLGALADEGALYLGGQTESESQHLALNVFAEPVSVFDSPNLAAFVHADVQDVHDHEEASAQAGQFRTDDKVVFLYFLKQIAEFAFVVILCAADGFLDPAMDLNVLPFAVFLDFEALVFNSLMVAAHPDITVVHSIIVVRGRKIAFFLPAPQFYYPALPDPYAKWGFLHTNCLKYRHAYAKQAFLHTNPPKTSHLYANPPVLHTHPSNPTLFCARN